MKEEIRKLYQDWRQEYYETYGHYPNYQDKYSSFIKWVVTGEI